MRLNLRFTKIYLIAYSLLGLICIGGAFFIKFSFDFEQFFPEGDEDLAFYKEFIKDFERDNNFLLIAATREEGAFDKKFLTSVRDATNDIKSISSVQKSQSIPTLRYPVKTPFGYTTKPLIHIDDPSFYSQDKDNILNDPRFKNTLIDEKAQSLVIGVKIDDLTRLDDSQRFMDSVKLMLTKNNITDYHLLGRPNFQNEIVRIQRSEFIFCSVVSLLLVILVIWSIYKSIPIVIVTVSCVTISLAIFVGFLGWSGRELSLMSALYPVIILIVSTSDVIHLITKYLDEHYKGHTDKQYIVNTTIKEVGLSTFITSISTSLGFLALMTSRLFPIRDFGFNCAVGVLLAFAVTLPLCLLLMSIIKLPPKPVEGAKVSRWDKLLDHIYLTTIAKKGRIVLGFLALIVVSLIGISKITTNYSITDNLPMTEQVGKDFVFFEENFNGFRPLEFAVLPQGDYDASSYEVVREIDKLETKLYEVGHIGNIISTATLFKSLKMVNSENQKDSFKLPNKEEYYAQLPLVKKMANGENDILISKNGKNARISSKVADIGADSVKAVSDEVTRWISTNIDSSVVKMRQTGTGLILDKNSFYVKDSLLWGLLFSLLSVSVLMAILLKDFRMFVIAFIPNFIPLLFIGALLGWLGIELEAGVSIIFGVVYGIVVDDTIHFFGRYKICLTEGMDVEQALKTTFDETGKAMLFTTAILFCAFLVMLFTAQPLTRTVGILISFTFLMAVFCDLYLIPVLIRWVYVKKIEEN